MALSFDQTVQGRLLALSASEKVALFELIVARIPIETLLQIYGEMKLPEPAAQPEPPVSMKERDTPKTQPLAEELVVVGPENAGSFDGPKKSSQIDDIDEALDEPVFQFDAPVGHPRCLAPIDPVLRTQANAHTRVVCGLPLFSRDGMIFCARCGSGSELAAKNEKKSVPKQELLTADAAKCIIGAGFKIPPLNPPPERQRPELEEIDPFSVDDPVDISELQQQIRRVVMKTIDDAGKMGIPQKEVVPRVLEHKIEGFTDSNVTEICKELQAKKYFRSLALESGPSVALSALGQERFLKGEL